MLQKQTFNLNLAKGLDTKSDPLQIAPGNFAAINNRVFTKAGLLQKRNGFGAISTLPSGADSQSISTYKGDLISAGNELDIYSATNQTWIDKGYFKPISLSTLSLARSSTDQSQCDSVILNGLICVVYTDQNVGGSSIQYKYSINDAQSGATIISPTAIPASTGAISGSPRVFALGQHFVIVISNTISAVHHLQYVAISSINPTSVGANTDISTSYVPATTVSFDGVVANNNLYLAWNGGDAGHAIRMTYIDSTLIQHGTKVFATNVCTMMSLTADESGATPVIYASFYDLSSTTGYVLAVNQILATILAPTQIISSGTILNITCTAQNGSVQVYYEVSNDYSFDTGYATNFIYTVNVTSGGTVGSTTTLIRSVGLGSKAVLYNGVSYMLVAYQSPLQPSYFLIDGSAHIVARLAYSSGGGYLTTGLPGLLVNGSVLSTAYLFQDLIEAVNKNINSLQSVNVYTQTGVNLAYFDFSPEIQTTAEIASDLQLSGGFMWMFDGNVPVENNFFVWPDMDQNDNGTYSKAWTTTTTGGNLAAQVYFYQITYEWTDNQGNVHRSAPSVAFKVDLSGSMTSTNAVILHIPTLRLSYKTSVTLNVYRWSTAQQIFYKTVYNDTIYSLINDPTVDSLDFIDINADSTILGNEILYTTGGVVEDISPPGSDVMTLYQSRLFMVDAEDRNLLWFSKVVIENTPVEMSDLLTFYVAPTIGASGSSGHVTGLFPMDGYLIIFKSDSIYYLYGNGPDNTGENSDYPAAPIFVNGTVGCANQNSIVFTSLGLMFQSDKGIWLLGRDLSTNYIGAPVEAFNSNRVTSATTIPGTTQVRFTLDNGMALIYDYYFNQWGTFSPVRAVSSTLFQSLHTYLDENGNVFQETPGVYVDGSNPVLTSLTTGWFNMAGLQGYQRAYFFFLLASYLSPHLLNVSIAYDYNPSPSQNVLIDPTNFSPVYGADPVYGNVSPMGGPSALEQWRVFFDRQQCQSFQLTIEEVYDSSFAVAPGAGFTLSGIDLVVGLKKGFRRIPAATSIG